MQPQKYLKVFSVMRKPMTKKDDSDNLKRKIASKKQFDLKCKVCHKKYGKFFTFHHKQYCGYG